MSMTVKRPSAMGRIEEGQDVCLFMMVIFLISIVGGVTWSVVNHKIGVIGEDQPASLGRFMSCGGIGLLISNPEFDPFLEENSGEKLSHHDRSDGAGRVADPRGVESLMVVIDTHELVVRVSSERYRVAARNQVEGCVAFHF